jgi:hypothetical protein
MKGSVSIGGRPQKGDSRSLHNWVGKFHITATQAADPFILAALNRALFGSKTEAVELRKAVIKEALKCQKDHEKAQAKRDAAAATRQKKSKS